MKDRLRRGEDVCEIQLDGLRLVIRDRRGQRAETLLDELTAKKRYMARVEERLAAGYEIISAR